MKGYRKAFWLVTILLILSMALSNAITEATPTRIPEMAVPEAPVKLRTARIRAVGDLMMHKKQLEIARQQDGSYDFHPQYALIADALGNADYTIANLETTVGKYNNMAYSGFPLFNAPETYLDAVKDAGVDFLTLANNHMLDRYFDGMTHTVELVDQWGFDHGGAYRTPEEQAEPVVVDVNGSKIGMLGYTQMTNGMERFCKTNPREYGIDYLKSDTFAEDVQKLRDAGAEVVIAMPHWGQEYRRKPEANTVSLAKKLVAAGVDVVLGSHPHMVQPVEYVTVETEDGGTRTGLVAYSLGNFVSNMVVQYTDSGIILDFTIREKQEGGFEIVDVGAVPVFCWRSGRMIQALSSLKYYDAKPEGMDNGRYARMKASYRELRDLLDDSIPMLEE